MHLHIIHVGLKIKLFQNEELHFAYTVMSLFNAPFLNAPIPNLAKKNC